MLGEDAFGVELHTFDIQAGMFHPHDFAIVGPCGYFQASWASGALDRQRVVAVHGELRWQTGKQTLLGGADDTGFAVHELLGPHDAAAKSSANGLMPQTDPQNR